jgi:uncharacterized protein
LRKIKLMKVAITGGTGFVGKHVVALLESLGYDVILIGRNEIKEETSLLKEKLKDIQIVVNLAGAPIMGRWTEFYKKIIYYSRIKTTTKMIYALDLQTVKLIISASAVGIYSGNGKQTETTYNYADDYLATICKAWEREAVSVSDKVRTVVFRFGVILGNGGALEKMLPLFKACLGGRIGSGKQGYSWVHIQDVIRAFSFVIQQKECNGIYNLTSPNPVTNAQFTKELAGVLKRKAFMAVPSFVLKWIYSEGASILTTGQLVYPERLLEEGFEFQYPDIKAALIDLIEKDNKG